MTRPSLALAVLLSAAVASGCGSKKSTTARSNLRQPSAIAIFRGYTVHDPARRLPYLAIANASRNDLTLVETVTDKLVDAPLPLRPLAIPFPQRPALLASAALGDDPPGEERADLLVGVSAGSSELQVVRTWTADNAIAATVDLHDDVVALVALPSPAGTARLAAALAGDKLAVVDFTRAPDGGIAAGAPEIHALGAPGQTFAAVSLAAVPGDEAHVYAATLDPIGPAGVHGVAEIDVSAPAEPWPVRALDARAPTRLVAAARLRERKRDATEDPEAAFGGQPVDAAVRRVYAVLDEGSCGLQKRIDCGLVALDPDKTPLAGDDHIPDDDWSVPADPPARNWMPYRAPIRFGASRPLAIAVAPPTRAPPSDQPGDAIYQESAGYMRLSLTATRLTATTAVAAVATEDGVIHFVDLGRFRRASSAAVPVAARARTVLPAFVPNGETRLWLRDPATGNFAVSADQGGASVGVTPGYTPDASWVVRYQGVFPGLEARSAEAGQDAGGLWIAIQVGEGPVGAHQTSQEARLYHPALGIAAGDLAVFSVRDANGTAICTLAAPAGGTAAPTEFELPITEILPPTADRPGGAVRLGRPSSGEPAACYDALLARTSPTTLAPRLLVTIRAAGLLLLRGAAYAGRPQLDTEYVLEYRAATGPDEDALAASCPLADWDGVFRPLDPPPACDATCRSACERLVLARLARRVHHLAEGCGGVQACADRLASAGQIVPFVNGPALKLNVGVEVKTGTAGSPVPVREHALGFDTLSGAEPVVDRPDGVTVHPNGALVFDRSVHVPSEGYRFFVSYPGNQVADVSPSVSPVARTVVR